MLNLFNANGNLDEIVFANRNKAYGAYQIRKQYDVTLTKAVFIMLSAFVLFYLLGLIPSSTKPNIIAKGSDEGVIWVERIIDIPIIDIPTKPENVSAGSTSNPKDGFVISADNKVAQAIITTTTSTNFTSTISSQIAGNGNPNVMGNLPGKITTMAAPSSPYSKIVEALPVFDNGNSELLKYLENNIEYPDRAKLAQVMGKVIVTFIVDENGVVSDIAIEKGIGFGCDEEAMRVVANMPKWKPALQNGKSGAVHMRLPIQFALN